MSIRSVFYLHKKKAAIAEPFFIWLKAEIEFYPVMTPEDLGKAGPAIEAAFKKWR